MWDKERFQKQVEDDLDVDQYNLQDEWTKQAQLFMSYSMEMSIVMKKKEKYRASLIQQITENPSSFNIEKLSEAAINRALEGDSKYIELNFQLSCLSNAVKAFEHKKRALEYETQLMIAGFFGEPKEKKPIRRKEKE